MPARIQAARTNTATITASAATTSSRDSRSSPDLRPCRAEPYCRVLMGSGCTGRQVESLREDVHAGVEVVSNGIDLISAVVCGIYIYGDKYVLIRAEDLERYRETE